MQSLARTCPCGRPAANARGVPRCGECRLARKRDYIREYKALEQRRDLVQRGLAPGDRVTAVCTWCEREFTYISVGRQRWKCDDCKRSSGSKLSTEWARRNPDRVHVNRRRYRNSAQGKRAAAVYNREVGRFRKFGIDRDWYERTLAAQDGRCANPGCRTSEPGGRHGTWHIDHDRSCCPASRSCGKCLRGLLCDACNKGLGMFGDDPARLTGAAEYLRAHARAAHTPGPHGYS